MSLKERLYEDLKDALRARDEPRKEAIRLLRAEVANAEIAWQREATDQDVQTIVSREVRRRGEALEIYRGAGREDLVAQEELAIRLLSDYLPRQLSPEEVREVVGRIVAELGATGPQDLGPVMRRAMAELRGQADGALVNQVARELLSR